MFLWALKFFKLIYKFLYHIVIVNDGEGKWKAKEIEKKHGKDKRRQSHDEKQKGAPDRSKRELNDALR